MHASWARAVQALGPADAHHAAWPWVLALMALLYLFETWFVRYV